MDYLTDHAVENGTYVITAAFTDEDGADLVPNAGLAWTLSDIDGVVVNSRQDVALAPSSSVDIVLSGADLAIQAGWKDAERRVLTIEGTYDGSLGSGLPIRAQVGFYVDNLAYVT